MYAITHVYLKQGRQISAYTPDELPLVKCVDMSRSDHNIKFAVSIYDDVNDKSFGLDASTILQERCDADTYTWQQFIDQLTEEWIIGYQCRLFGFIPNTTIPRITEGVYYPFHAEGLVPHYCNIKTPDLMDVFQFRWDMPDLAIEKTDENLAIDFSNCIPVVNGLSTMSHVHDGKLYIHDGAKLLWCTNETWRPDALLIDTTPLGKLTTVPFRDLTVWYRNRSGNRYLNCEWEINLPEGYNFTTHTVILIIGGIMYFPDEYQITSDHTLLLNPCTLALDKHLLMKYKAMNRIESVVETEASVSEYLTDGMWADDCHDAFLAIIENPKIYVNRIHTEPYAGSRLGLVDGNKGLLMLNSTHQVLAYTESRYNSNQLLYTENNQDTFFFDTPFRGKAVGSYKFPCPRETQFKNLRLSGFTLIHLVSGA